MEDSTKETLEHKALVQKYLTAAAVELLGRSIIHDNSKLEEPEKPYFDAVAGTIGDLEYGSEEYKKQCEFLKPALEHHYKHNSHHPQYYGEKLTNGMNLFDVIEMFFDWRASTERTKGGNIYKSLEKNQSRLAISKQLRTIFENTAEYLGYERPKE